MSLAERLTDQIRKMLGRPANEKIDPELGLRNIAKVVVETNKIAMALVEERKMYRCALVGLAFMCGQMGFDEVALKATGNSIALIAWPPDPDEEPAKKEPEGRVLKIGKMVSLH